MIVVSGTMRSGTSMWMQILSAGGFEHIGEAFPKRWGERLRSANPRGFYESELVAGIHAATNPHPVTGAYLFPEETIDTAVKVFIPGLLRSDVAFLDRVVVTMRPWREVAASMERLDDLQSDIERGATPLKPALAWWMENFGVLRDIAIRRYAAHVTSYHRLVDDPEREIRAVFGWLGRGDVDAAVQAVTEDLRRSTGEDVEADLEPEYLDVFDELYDQVHRGRDLSPAFVRKLNRVDRELQPRLIDAREAMRQDLLRRLTQDLVTGDQ